MAKLTIPPQELLRSGHSACPGCGAALAMRYVLKALGPETIVSVPASFTTRYHACSNRTLRSARWTTIVSPSGEGMSVSMRLK